MIGSARPSPNHLRIDARTQCSYSLTVITIPECHFIRLRDNLSAVPDARVVGAVKSVIDRSRYQSVFIHEYSEKAPIGRSTRYARKRLLKRLGEWEQSLDTDFTTWLVLQVQGGRQALRSTERKKLDKFSIGFKSRLHFISVLLQYCDIFEDA